MYLLLLAKCLILCLLVARWEMLATNRYLTGHYINKITLICNQLSLAKLPNTSPSGNCRSIFCSQSTPGWESLPRNYYETNQLVFGIVLYPVQNVTSV